MTDPKDFAGDLEQYPGQREYEDKAAERQREQEE